MKSNYKWSLPLIPIEDEEKSNSNPMKPKFRIFARKGLPASIILASSIILPANGLQIPVTPTGDLTVTPANNGANYISASGGSNAAPVVTVQAGVNLTGDPVLLPSGTVVNVTLANYTIDNSGILNSGGAGAAIASGAFGVNVLNQLSGEIYSGPTAGSSGITGGSGTMLTNSGSIIGVLHGLQVTGNAGSITNNATGIIIGDQNATTGGSAIAVSGNLAPSTNAGTLNGATGISVGGTATINNSGTINAGLGGVAGDGIRILGTGAVTNSGSITVDPTATGSGIAFQGTGSSLINSGTIAAAGHAVYFLGDNAGFTNSGSLNGDADGNGDGHGLFVAGNLPLGSNAAGGVIQGAGGVVIGGSGTSNFTNNGTITGLTLSGISAVNGALILTNTSTIAGSVNGAEGGVGSSLVNSGNITGTTGDAVQFGDASSVDNTAGTLSGGNHGVNINGNAVSFNNAGIILGNADAIGSGNGVNITGSLPLGTNSGSIQGVTGVLIGGAGNTVFGNTGTIIGTTDNGFQAANAALVLTNGNTITGQLTGVFGGADSLVSNTGNITGTIEDGISLGDASSVANDAGTILGGKIGIYIDGNALSVTNAAGATITGTSIAGVGVTGNLLSGINAGTITGATGIIVDGDATISNTGTITGTSFDGIHALGVLNLTNDSIISGQRTGAYGGDNSNVTNNASITGTTLNGLDLGTNAIVRNNASITGLSNGILVTGDATSIINSAGGTITGTDLAGVHVTNNLVSGVNNGSVTGLNGFVVGNNAVLTNTGVITGTGEDGVQVENSLILNNTGTITGVIDDGVEAGDNSVITNSSIITGVTGLDIYDSTAFTLNNTGTITGTGGVAIDTGSGVDTLNLNNNSIVNGNINTRAGNDTLTFTGGLGRWDSGDITGNIVHGDVENVESLIKNGPGYAFIGDGGVDLNGDGITDGLFDSTIDSITVNGGGLLLNTDLGPVAAAITTIQNNSFLGGQGQWNANITNASGSTFSPGAVPLDLAQPAGTASPAIALLDSIGKVTDSGNVTFQSGSHFQIDIDPNQGAGAPGTGFDQLALTGSGKLNISSGTMLVTAPLDVNQTVQNGSYVIGQTTAGVNLGNVITGVKFENNVLDGGENVGTETLTGTAPTATKISTNTLFGQYFVTYVVQGTNLVQVVDHDYGNLPGLTRSESSLGDAFQIASYNRNPAVQDFLASIDYSDLGEAQNLFNAISPEEQLGHIAGVMNSNYRLHRQTQNRLAGLRKAGTAPEIVHNDSKSGLDAKGGSVTAAPGISYGGKWNVWGALSYDKHEVDGDRNRLDQDDEVRAVTAGLDYRFNDSLVVGGLIDASDGDFDSKSSGADVDSLRFALYGTYGKATGFYSDFLLGYNTHEIDGRRNVNGSTNVLGGRRTSSFDADGIQGLWTAGYTFEYSHIKHGPFAGLEYQKLSVDGFDERGVATPLSTSVDDFDVESIRGLIGYRADAEFGRFRPYASVAYAHEFGDDEGQTKVHLGGPLTGYSFTAYGPEQGSAILVSVGTGISLTQALTLDIGYRGEYSVDGDGGNSNGGSVGLNWEF